MKKRHKLLILIAAFLLAFTFGVSLVAYAETAEEQEPLEETQEATDNEQLVNDLTDIFYEKYLPLIIVAGTGAITLLGMLYPFIKQIAKYKGLQSLYSAQNVQLKDCSEKLKVATTVDYKGIIESKLQELIKPIESFFVQTKIDQQLMSEQLNKIIAAASVAWKEADGAVEMLSTIPTATALKKTMLIKKKLEDYIVQTKGDEADKIIADIEEAAVTVYE